MPSVEEWTSLIAAMDSGQDPAGLGKKAIAAGIRLRSPELAAAIQSSLTDSGHVTTRLQSLRLAGELLDAGGASSNELALAVLQSVLSKPFININDRWPAFFQLWKKGLFAYTRYPPLMMLSALCSCIAWRSGDGQCMTDVRNVAEKLLESGHAFAGMVLSLLQKRPEQGQPDGRPFAAGLLYSCFSGSGVDKALGSLAHPDRRLEHQFQKPGLVPSILCDFGKTGLSLTPVLHGLLGFLGDSLLPFSSSKQLEVTKLISSLAGLPHIGNGQPFRDMLNAEKSSLLPVEFRTALSVFLEMKEVSLHCPLFRFLHNRWSHVPGHVWLNIIDFVGLFKSENRQHATTIYIVTPKAAHHVGSENVELDVDGHAAEVFETTTIEEVQHGEPGTVIPPDEAALITSELCWSLVDRDSKPQHPELICSSRNEMAAEENCVSGQQATQEETEAASPSPASNKSPMCAGGCLSCSSSLETRTCNVDQPDGQTSKPVCITFLTTSNSEEPPSSGPVASLASKIHDAPAQAVGVVPVMGRTEGLVDDASSGDEEVASHSDVLEFQSLVLLNFNRHPHAFEEQLFQDEALEKIRAALELAGHSSKLCGGAKVFVSPSEYKTAMDAIKGWKLGPSHVIVSGQLEQTVLSAAKLPRAENVRVKDRKILCYADDCGHVCEVKRSFLCSVRPHNDEQLTCSSTQARCGNRNPRAVPTANNDLA